MGVVIKKISKKTFFSILSVSAFVVAFFIRLFFGGSHISLSQLESKAGDVFKQDGKIISTARADTPGYGGGEGGGCGSSDGSEGCGEGGSGDGA